MSLPAYFFFFFLFFWGGSPFSGFYLYPSSRGLWYEYFFPPHAKSLSSSTKWSLFDSLEDILALSMIFTWSLTLASQDLLDENVEFASSFSLSFGIVLATSLVVVPLQAHPPPHMINIRRRMTYCWTTHRKVHPFSLYFRLRCAYLFSLLLSLHMFVPSRRTQVTLLVLENGRLNVFIYCSLWEEPSYSVRAQK